MENRFGVLEGQLNNFILFSLGIDIEKKSYFDSKIYPDNYNYNYITIYEWLYDDMDKNALEEFLNGD